MLKGLKGQGAVASILLSPYVHLRNYYVTINAVSK
jgi:hypothetical protein